MIKNLNIRNKAFALAAAGTFTFATAIVSCGALISSALNGYVDDRLNVVKNEQVYDNPRKHSAIFVDVVHNGDSITLIESNYLDKVLDKKSFSVVTKNDIDYLVSNGKIVAIDRDDQIEILARMLYGDCAVNFYNSYEDMIIRTVLR